MKKELKRSKQNAMIGGVCGGIAEYFDIDYSIARILYLLFGIISGGLPALLVYFILILIIPQDDTW